MDKYCKYICTDQDSNEWGCDTCDNIWTLNDGNPFDNNMNYCNQCGRFIKAITFTEYEEGTEEDEFDTLESEHTILNTNKIYDCMFEKGQLIKERDYWRRQAEKYKNAATNLGAYGALEHELCIEVIRANPPFHSKEGTP